jgi:hypothetical protein
MLSHCTLHLFTLAMAELATTASIIGTILSTFKRCFSFVKTISSALHEARSILTHLQACEHG